MYNKSNYYEAMKYFDEAISISPNHNPSIYYRSLCYYKLTFIYMRKIDDKSVIYSKKRDNFLKNIKEYEIDSASAISQ